MLQRALTVSGGGGGGTYVKDDTLTYNVPKTYNINNGAIMVAIYYNGSISGSVSGLIENGVFTYTSPTSGAVTISYSDGVLTVTAARNDYTSKMNAFYID